MSWTGLLDSVRRLSAGAHSDDGRINRHLRSRRALHPELYCFDEAFDRRFIRPEQNGAGPRACTVCVCSLQSFCTALLPALRPTRWRGGRIR